MAKFLIVSVNGDGLPLAHRMQEEGADVTTYIHVTAYRDNYEGMLKQRLKDEKELASFVDDMDPETIVLCDMTKAIREEDPEDEVFLNVVRRAGKSRSTKNLFGPWCDELRKAGYKVIGNSATTEVLEMDRAKGNRLAAHLGLSMPRKQAVPDLAGALAFLKGKKQDRWVLKPHDNYDLAYTYIERFPGELYEKLRTPWGYPLAQRPMILEEYIPGITYDEEAWFDGEKFVCCNSTLERKRFGAGDTGPHVGSMLNLVWSKEIQKAKVPWVGLKKTLERAHYIGPVNATFQLQGQNLYFLEWTFRLGYDAIFGLMSLSRSPISRFFSEGFGTGFSDETWAATVRFSVPPYPYDHLELRDQAKGVVMAGETKQLYLLDVKEGVRGQEVVGADGVVGVSVGMESRGYGVKNAFERALALIDKAKVAADVQYRSDYQGVCDDWKIVDRTGFGF